MPQQNLVLQGNDKLTSQANSTGKTPIPSTGAATLVASVTVESNRSLGVSGWITAGQISDVIVAIASMLTMPGITGYEDTGNAVNVLVASSGDFNTASSFLTLASNGIATTAAGSGFVFHLALDGKIARVDIFLKSTTPGTIATIDVSGDLV